MTTDEIRESPGYRRELERLRRTLADPGRDRKELLAEWIEFGKLPRWKQWVTPKPCRTYEP